MNEMSGGSSLFQMTLRAPPSNPQAEQALLGAILTNNKALHRVVEFLRPEHFADPAHGRIYKEACRRVFGGGVADAVSMHTWWSSDTEAEALGAGYLGQLLTAMVGLVGVREYGVAILECWQRRELIGAGEEVVNGSFAGQEAPATMAARLIDQLDAVVAGEGADRKAVMFDVALEMAVERARLAAERTGPAGLSTGMPRVDAALGGLEPQTLTIVAARPGMGKSALAMDWAVHVARMARAAHAAGAKQQGVLVVSLEMSAEQQARRTLAAAGRIPLEALKNGRLDQQAWDRLIAAQVEMAGLPLSIEDCSGLSIGMIRLKARAARRRHGLGLIVVDHLHIVRPEDVDVRNGATAAIGKISNGMKQLAKEFDCPVVALAQLNRALESREEKRPTLADLRQAGEIEQDADAVGFIYRAEYYLPKGEPERGAHEALSKFNERCLELDEARVRLKGKAELIFEKVRDGAPQTVPLLWNGQMTHFSEAAA